MSKAQIEFLQRCKAFNLHSGSLNDWLDRIEELERERDTFYMDYRMKCDEQTKSLCVERDALQADNARLRDALEAVRDQRIEGYVFPAVVDLNAWHSKVINALAATPEQSLAAYRNKVIEECAKRAEAYAYMSQNFNALAEELRAMKEQP